MDPRTTTTGRLARSRRRPPAAVRRPALYLGVATAGAVLVGAVVGPEPAAQAEAAPSETVSVARELGLTAASGPVDVTTELQPLQDLAASRSTREAAEAAAQQAQAAADQAVLDRQRAEADAAARAAAEADAAARAAAEASARQVAPAQAGAAAPAAAAPRAAAAAPGRVARITNSSGPVAPRVQAAADRVVSDVPGAGSITLGGTRPSATDPGGHPSGNALDYMVLTDAGLGDAIAAYHIAHWDELGVEYVIWQQRMLSSPNGSWKPMADRGGTTANHYDHVHVNYRG